MATNHQLTRRGYALFVCLILVGLLSIFAGGMLRIVLPEIAGAHHAERAQIAFFRAEAGARYTVRMISDMLNDGSLILGGPSVPLPTPPAAILTEYGFEPATALQALPHNREYYFSITGVCHNARTTIEITIRRPRLLADVGVFGDRSVTVQPNGSIFSYHSSTVANPQPADSTGEANIGSNEQITFRPNVQLDGLVTRGADLFGNPPPAPAGYDSASVGRITPDPLGAQGGVLAQAFAHYSQAANNNNGAVADIKSNKLNIRVKDSVTLPPGRYYLRELTLASKSELIVAGTTANPTIIYLDGELSTQPNTDFNANAARPSNLFIFSRSDEDIRVQPNGDFNAFLYAPYADIRVQPNNGVRGIIWGRTVTVQPGNDIWIDVDLLDAFLSGTVEIAQWRQISP
ncbi:MAG: hypothetical protein K9N49_10375 [Candidatus Marinimicrobia bacterium]|nr:hypothetical protein [Candidatus Neomarinimicrobiota bacterium]